METSNPYKAVAVVKCLVPISDMHSLHCVTTIYQFNLGKFAEASFTNMFARAADYMS